ncbi:MAG: hypothetical protein WC375_03630 [Methanomassiliicoccales archaeon]|jgi:hypothetical protein
MKNILTDIFILLAIFLGVALFSSNPELNKELNQLFNQDIGNFLVTIGALWTIGSFFKIGNPANTLGSLSCSFGIFLLGYSLSDFGLFYAFITIGWYLLIICILTFTIKPRMACVLFLIGVILLLVGYPCRQSSVPTGPPPPASTEYPHTT